MINWPEKVTVITGAGSGIGRAIAKNIAAKGGNIALVDVSEKGLSETLAILSSYPGKFTTHVANVTDESQMKALPEAIIAKHRQIDVLFNNAGITIDKTFAEHTLEDWRKIIGINIWGVIYGCHFFLPYLESRPEAHIATTSSLAGFLGFPKQTSYCLTKAAVKGFNEALYAEYKHKNVHVTSIHPGAINTNLFNVAVAHSVDQAASRKFFDKVQKFAMPADKAAGIIVKAVEKRKMRIRVGMDSVLTDIAKRLMPVGMHKILAKVYQKQEG